MVCLGQDDAVSLKEDLEEPEDLEVHDEKGKQKDLIKLALDLFSLKEYRLMFEPATDTKAMIGWNDNTILVSFRGTASIKAAKLDLEASVRPCFLCVSIWEDAIPEDPLSKILHPLTEVTE